MVSKWRLLDRHKDRNKKVEQMNRKEKQIMELEARIEQQQLTPLNEAILISIDCYLAEHDVILRNKYWTLIRVLALPVFPEVFRRGRK